MPDKVTERLLIGGLSPRAAEALDREQRLWRKHVSDEAGRLAAERGNGTEHEEISPGDITMAVKNLRTRQSPNTAATWLSASGQITSYFSAITVGYFINNITKSWGAIGFAIFFTIGIISALAYILPGRRG